ncbi:MAG: toll/interleukin-1 receptor domain-containing protein [Candidatus Viridilinea halotolerans]|uniref:Toll/interleukin-1 receptor domain-containing protein n=1 Tax=Candidatus Viridilinea halotolerans TaxID=2491704 RepID=A0A426U4H4_9CHLR|nr:MAG: toll/interleukin-1 receptor domain-containing protein [Candidatus Viridilinea halotolerans]
MATHDNDLARRQVSQRPEGFGWWDGGVLATLLLFAFYRHELGLWAVGLTLLLVTLALFTRGEAAQLRMLRTAEPTEQKSPRILPEPVRYLPPLPPPPQAEPEYAYDCFLSYHAPDREAARVLVAQLKAAGLRPWFDQDEIRTGQPWMERVEQGLAQSRATLVLIGTHGVGRWQRQEAHVAIRQAIAAAGARPVIPVLLPGADRCGLPPLLDSFSWVEFAHGLDDADAFERLVVGCGGS